MRDLAVALRKAYFQRYRSYFPTGVHELNSDHFRNNRECMKNSHFSPDIIVSLREWILAFDADCGGAVTRLDDYCSRKTAARDALMTYSADRPFGDYYGEI